MAEEAEKIRLGSGEDGQIVFEDLYELDLNELLRHPLLGPFKIEYYNTIFENIRYFLLEFHELYERGQYISHITENEDNAFDNAEDNFIWALNQIQDLPATVKGNDNPEKKQNEILRVVKRVWNQYTPKLKSVILYQRVHSLYETIDVDKLKQVTADSSHLNEEMNRKLSEVDEKLAQLDSKQGQEASEEFETFFKNQANNSKEKKTFWFWVGVVCFVILTFFLAGNFIFFVTGAWIYPSEEVSTDSSVVIGGSVRYGVASISIIVLLSYAVGFSSKQYNIYANQQVVNEHRQNVAKTLTRFYQSTSINDEAKAEIVRQGTEAMFENQATGHINKGRHHEDGGPANTIVQKIPFNKG